MPLKPCQRPIVDAVSPRLIPACVAFTIRAWSRRTIVWAFCQVMACQSTAMWETAPAGVAPAVICFVSSIGLPLSLVMQDPHGKSARFRVGSHGHVLNPYPPPYRMAFASSRVPYPHPRGLVLRLAFPYGRDTGLPRSARIPLDELGSACPPVAQHLREVMGKCLHLATYLLVQASQPLWLVSSHDVYQRFTSVSHIIPP
jgi:hypothetical protein